MGGKTFRDIRREFPEEYRMRESTWGTYHPRRRKFPPGDDARCTVYERKSTMSSREKVLLFITHAGVIRTLCCCRDGRNPDELLHYRIGYGEYMVWEAERADMMERLKDQGYH